MASFNPPAPLIPPPSYERGPRDPETSSIVSAAPSYVSDRPPSYVRRELGAASSGPPSAADSQTTLTEEREPDAPQVVDTPQEVRQGLPALRYAPGFSARGGGNIADVENHSYNIRSWSSVHSGNAARQYQNVAARRHSQASSSFFSSASPANSVPSASMQSASTTASSSRHNYTSSVSSSPSTAASSVSEPGSPPFSPREDPALVGETAAARAKAQRLYRETCMRGAEGMKHESQSWDFMLGQMTDWDERERSWTQFRREVTVGKGRLGGKFLGRKIRLAGLRDRM